MSVNKMSGTKMSQKPKTPPEGTRKPNLENLSLNDTEAAADDPIGACQFTDNSGQIDCVDNITKSECAKFKNSIFLVGETCD